jgi:ribonuclease HI
MYFDGLLNLEGAGAGVLLISPTGEQLKYVLQIFWKVSNNEAEYEALLHGFRLAASLGIKRLLVTPSFKGKTECIDHVCARIKLHTRLDIMNIKISATQIESYYKP